MAKVTDPELLTQLEGTQRLKKVTDPGLLAQLESNVETTPQQDTGNPVMNALYGFAARGNQAITALNPLASQESQDKIAAEQEWVKQHKGAGIGSMLADMAITAPAGGGTTAPIRSILAGAIEGSTQHNGYVDKLKDMALGTIGAGLGEGAANALGFIAKPFKSDNNPVIQALRDRAERMGIKLNAAQATGNKSLQYADSALDFIPSSSVAQQEFKNAQREAWQKALFKQGGENATAPTQDVMGAMKDRISSVYQDVAGRNNIIVDQPFKNAMNNIKHDLMGRIPTNQKGIVKSYLKDFDTAPLGAAIPGTQYQEIRSMLDKQAKSFKNTDPATHQALKNIRDAADKAMERSVSPTDSMALRKANNDWAVMKNIEGAIEPTTAIVSAPKFVNALTRRDPNRMIYGNGDQELNDIAKVGKQFISPSVPDSGTAQRAAMIKLLTGATAAGYAGDLAYTHDPVGAAGGAGAALLGAILLPKVAGSMMRNPNGYLANGLIDMSKRVMNGPTRQRIAAELMRNIGTQTTNQLRE